MALLAGCGGGTTTVVERTIVQTVPAGDGTTATTPTTTGQDGGTSSGGAGGATTPSEAPTEIRTLSAFRSPTGNIGCMLFAALARCDVADRRWSLPARPASCPDQVEFGQGAQVGRQGAGRLVCAGDTARDPTAPVLAYGTGASIGPFVCVSRSSGMTCTNSRTGHGFTVTAQDYRLF